MDQPIWRASKVLGMINRQVQLTLNQGMTSSGGEHTIGGARLGVAQEPIKYVTIMTVPGNTGSSMLVGHPKIASKPTGPNLLTRAGDDFNQDKAVSFYEPGTITLLYSNVEKDAL